MVAACKKVFCWTWPQAQPLLVTLGHRLRGTFLQRWGEFQAWPRSFQILFAAYTGLISFRMAWESSGRASPLTLETALALPFVALAVLVLGVKTKERLKLFFD